MSLKSVFDPDEGSNEGSNEGRNEGKKRIQL